MQVIVVENAYGPSHVLDASTQEAFIDSAIELLDYEFNHARRIYDPQRTLGTDSRTAELLAVDEVTLAAMPGHMAEEVRATRRLQADIIEQAAEQQEFYDWSKRFLASDAKAQRETRTMRNGSVIPTAWMLLCQLVRVYNIDDDYYHLTTVSTSL